MSVSTQIIRYEVSQTVRPSNILHEPKLQAMQVDSSGFRDLDGDWEYLARLYYNAGVVTQPKNPVFFVEILFGTDTSDIFKMVYYLST